MLKPIKLAKKNFLSSLDISSEELLHILEIAKNFKNKDLTIELKNKVLAISKICNNSSLEISKLDKKFFFASLIGISIYFV